MPKTVDNPFVKPKPTYVRVQGGVGFISLLTLLFIALKLTGYVQWSWLWVLSPLWISALMSLALLGVALAFAITGMIIYVIASKGR